MKVNGIPVMWTLSLVIFLLFTLYYVMTFIMVKYSSPNKSQTHDVWIRQVCAPKGIYKTLISIGYFKLSVKIIFRSIKLWFQNSSVEVGSRAPNIKLVRLDGTHTDLKKYTDQLKPMTPLVLNFGSLT